MLPSCLGRHRVVVSVIPLNQPLRVAGTMHASWLCVEGACHRPLSNAFPTYKHSFAKHVTVRVFAACFCTMRQARLPFHFHSPPPINGLARHVSLTVADSKARRATKFSSQPTYVHALAAWVGAFANPHATQGTMNTLGRSLYVAMLQQPSLTRRAETCVTYIPDPRH